MAVAVAQVIRNVTIDVGGQRRLMLSIKEHPPESDSPGDLHVILRHPPYVRIDVEGENPPKKREIENVKVTIHRTLKSEQITAITNTIKMDDKAHSRAGDNKILHYTEAMKQHGCAAVLFAVRSTDLSHPTFLLDDPLGEDVSLGSYDPKHFQVFYQVAVSSLDARQLAFDDETNWREIDFTYFRITILWTFASVPSEIMGHIFFIGTMKPEDLRELADENLKAFLRAVAAGFETKDLLGLFRRWTRTLLMDDFVATAERLSGDQDLLKFLRASAFFKKGDPDGAKYRRHSRQRARILLRGSRVPSPPKPISFTPATYRPPHPR
jgi:hypothetical protein